jgi:Zn-dependent alcohol dehydrogenase
MRSLVPLAVACLLACASAPDAVAPVLDLSAEDAASCRPLGDVSETEYSGMRFTTQAREAARDKVRAAAAELGATHVVWSSEASGSGKVQVASAKAYDCSADSGRETQARGPRPAADERPSAQRSPSFWSRS